MFRLILNESSEILPLKYSQPTEKNGFLLNSDVFSAIMPLISAFVLSVSITNFIHSYIDVSFYAMKRFYSQFRLAYEVDSVAENGYNANEYIRNNIADVQFVRKIHFCYLNEK